MWSIYHHILSYIKRNQECDPFIIIYHHILSYIVIYHYCVIHIYQKKPRVYCSLWPNWTIYVQNGSQHPYFPACVHMDFLPINRHIASFIGHVRHAKSPFSVHGPVERVESRRVESDLSSVRSPKRFEILASRGIILLFVDRSTLPLNIFFFFLLIKITSFVKNKNIKGK